MPYGRDKAKTQNVAAQAAFLSAKLNFGPPSKVAPQAPPPANKSKGISYKFHGNDDGGGGGGRSKGVSKDPNFSANRAAIAEKFAFGGKKPPPEPANARGAPRSADNIPKPSGGKEFQNQKAALAGKLNFRPPLPAGDPRANASNAPPNRRPGPPARPAQKALAQNGAKDFSANRAAIASQLAFGKSKPAPPPKPNPPPPRRRNDNNGTEFSNQRAALASKLVFRPPLPASSTSGGPQGMAQPPRPQEPSYSPARVPVPVGDMDLADLAAEAASVARSYHPEDATTTTSSDAVSLHSARSVDPPPEPEMSFEMPFAEMQDYSIHKDHPPPVEPEMKYVRSYHFGGTEEPKEEPATQVIPKKAAVDERIQVVLVSGKYEWGTKPLKKRYQGNRVTVKHFTTDEKEERKRQRNKNGGGCSIM
mmetsp:Transcript_29002/g.70041  ORF Transcript_29002/g.70041 Transcript_29002/m.70041 type:complete len:420 (+) Transcript_29002:116-1375(+)